MPPTIKSLIKDKENSKKEFSGLKSLISTVESLNFHKKELEGDDDIIKHIDLKLEGIKTTVEAVNDLMKDYNKELPIAMMIAHGYEQSKELQEKLKDFQKLKDLVGVK